MTNVQRICAIFTHFSSRENTLTCLQRLAQQSRPADKILIINNSTADDEGIAAARAWAAEKLAPDCLHILQMESNLGNAGGCAHGLNHAFGVLGADFVWVLDDDSWPRPDSLENLLAEAADENTVRMSLVIDPRKQDELSWPLSIIEDTEEGPRYRNALCRKDLPKSKRIPSRGGWLGALYPRKVWQSVGVPTPELFIRGEDEEYPWKVRNAGFNFITVRDSELEHPSSKKPLLHFVVAGRSFFYEMGLADSRYYYKVRNWAWLQRCKRPQGYLQRLAACGVYIILSLNFMMRTDELTFSRLYCLFRALHNGFYGKLRPY